MLIGIRLVLGVTRGVQNTIYSIIKQARHGNVLCLMRTSGSELRNQ